MTLEERMDELTERVERLSELYGDVLHTYNLLSVLVPKSADANIKFMRGCGDYYFRMSGDVAKFRDILLTTLDDLQEHYKSHYLDKKNPKSEYDTVTLEE